MKRTLLVLLSIGAAVNCWGQLVPGQKLADFQNLASLFAKQYAPFQWKLELFDYNLYKISPWVDMVQQTTDDLGFYEVMAEYVTALNDAHSEYFNPSDFTAYLGFTTDIYDGKVLIDFIDPTVIAPGKYSFQVGDELVMVDGQTTAEIITNLSQFFSDANTASTTRDAAGYIPFRAQTIDPRAEAVGVTASVVIRRQAGNLETYTIPWVTSGTPLTKIGPVPFPQSTAHTRKLGARSIPPNTPGYLAPMYQVKSRLPFKRAVLNFDVLQPVFNLPSNFVQRLGNGANDVFFTGTYKSGSKTIGYIRIADFEPNDTVGAESSFDGEIAYMQQNTDGLVVDVMRNPGGYVCYAEDLESRLMTKPFHDAVMELRPLLSDVQTWQYMTEQAIADGAPTYVIEILQQQTRFIEKAYENGGLTGPIPICQIGATRAPNTGANGKPAVYSKPILMLTDLFSASGAELFASMFQDAKRGPIYGTRTMGAGGVVSDGNPAGYYSEGQVSVTYALVIRENPITVAGYPTAPLYENIGVQADIQNDYMTMANLLSGGTGFVNAFTAEIVKLTGN